VRLLARAILFGLFQFRIETSGRELLPRGGYLLVGAAHRGWMDPFVVMHALPLEPRCWFLGSGPSTFTSPFREWFVRRIGGLLPVWRGGIGVDAHVRSARAVVEAGAVFVQMPEGTVNGPPGTLGPFRPGAGLIALRVEGPIVPLAIAGTEELYLGRRMASRILPATTVAELLGPRWDGARPAPGSREELDLARRITDALAERLRPVVEELHAGTVDPPGRPRRLRRRLTWLLLGPGPLEH
jgi:Acyltransferase